MAAAAPLSRLSGLAARFWRDEAGNATLEFAVLVPQLLLVMFSLAELGLYMTRSVMISRGTDMAIRDLRLGIMPLTGAPDTDIPIIKQGVCENAFLVADCVDQIQIEMHQIDGNSDGDITLAEINASIGSAPTDCVDRSEETLPFLTYEPGSAGQTVFVRVCLVVEPLFPWTGLGAQLPPEVGGGYAIISSSAYMNEPA